MTRVHEVHQSLLALGGALNELLPHLTELQDVLVAALDEVPPLLACFPEVDVERVKDALGDIVMIAEPHGEPGREVVRHVAALAKALGTTPDECAASCQARYEHWKANGPSDVELLQIVAETPGLTAAEIAQRLRENNARA